MVERGEDPVCLIRDPAINESIRIELSKQQEKFWTEREPADA